MKECASCDWCKPLENNKGEIFYFCTHDEGGAYLEETGLCGWCDLEDESDEL